MLNAARPGDRTSRRLAGFSPVSVSCHNCTCYDCASLETPFYGEPSMICGRCGSEESAAGRCSRCGATLNQQPDQAASALTMGGGDALTGSVPGSTAGPAVAGQAVGSRSKIIEHLGV